jgi:hypothetical protein
MDLQENVNGTEEVEVNDEEEDEEMGGIQLAEDKEESEEEEIEGEEEEEDIPLSDLSEDERADVIPHQRLTINNSAAINASIKRISFINAQTPFSEHNSLVSTDDVDVPDPNDDLTRELAFYKVCQAAAIEARRTLKKEGVNFTRPTDYFAEMVKTDEHMTKIKKKLFDEAASKKAAADARRQRDLKKFGKQVQVAKLQQRQKEKKETLEKINSLKRSTLPPHLLSVSIDSNTSQNARLNQPDPPITTMTSSTSPSTTTTRRPPSAEGAEAKTPQEQAAQTQNDRRRTRNTDSAARSDSQNPAMPRPQLIYVDFRPRR